MSRTKLNLPGMLIVTLDETNPDYANQINLVPSAVETVVNNLVGANWQAETKAIRKGRRNGPGNILNLDLKGDSQGTLIDGYNLGTTGLLLIDGTSLIDQLSQTIVASRLNEGATVQSALMEYYYTGSRAFQAGAPGLIRNGEPIEVVDNQNQLLITLTGSSQYHQNYDVSLLNDLAIGAVAGSSYDQTPALFNQNGGNTFSYNLRMGGKYNGTNYDVIPGEWLLRAKDEVSNGVDAPVVFEHELESATPSLLLEVDNVVTATTVYAENGNLYTVPSELYINQVYRFNQLGVTGFTIDSRNRAVGNLTPTSGTLTGEGWIYRPAAFTGDYNQVERSKCDLVFTNTTGAVIPAGTYLGELQLTAAITE